MAALVLCAAAGSPAPPAVMDATAPSALKEPPDVSAGKNATDPAGSEEALSGDLSVRPLGPGLWLHRSMTRLGGVPVFANGLVVGSATGAMLIDTPWNDEQTTLLLDWIEDRLGVPVLQVAVTHYHADRMGGIAAVHARGIPTYGSQLTAEMARKNGIPPPGRTFEYQMSLKVGEETVELFYPGPGHTQDNIVVWLQQSRVLFGGCLVRDEASAGLGNTEDANLAEWPRSLARVAERYPDPALVIPGHGAPGDRGLIAGTLHLLGRGDPG